MATLKVEKRDGTGKYVAFNLRKKGYIPGVIYGKDMKENVNIQIPLKEFMHLLHEGNRILDVDVDGEGYHTIVKDVQHGTFDHEILHADFRRISESDTLNLEVEIELVGDSAGVAAGGVIEQAMFQVEIACSPANLPNKIKLNITNMQVDDVLYVSDLPKLDGVKYLTAEDVTVASCHMPAGEEELEAEAAEEEAGATEPEVIGAKKDEDEGDED